MSNGPLITESSRRDLTADEISHVLDKNYIVIDCDCGNVLFVRPNTNLEPCYQVRCMVCKASKSYTLNFDRVKKTGVLKVWDCPSVGECFKKKLRDRGIEGVELSDV